MTASAIFSRPDLRRNVVNREPCRNYGGLTTTGICITTNKTSGDTPHSSARDVPLRAFRDNELNAFGSYQTHESKQAKKNHLSSMTMTMQNMLIYYFWCSMLLFLWTFEHEHGISHGKRTRGKTVVSGAMDMITAHMSRGVGRRFFKGRSDRLQSVAMIPSEKRTDRRKIGK